MKGQKPSEILRWNLKDVSKCYGISIEALRNRCQRLKIRPITHEGNYSYMLNSVDIDKVIEYSSRKGDILPEVIYITRTTVIYPSMLNFLPLSKLKQQIE